MLTLIITGLSTFLGLEFDWLFIHWIVGIGLTAVVLFHICRSVSWQKLGSMWISIQDLKTFVSELRIEPAQMSKPGKYSLAQRLMHHAVTIFCLLGIGTGLAMLVRIDTSFWERNPYLLSQATWGVIYVIHGLATLIFVSLIIIHVYFALRPEKLFYTRSMIIGWITRREYIDNHDPELWNADDTSTEDPRSGTVS